MRYVFGDCELDTTSRELRRAGQPVLLEPRVYEVLVYLVRHRHRIVHKNELLRSVWPSEVARDNTLTRCIQLARRAIGCDAHTQPYIMTHYRVGYGFRAAVTEDHLAAPAWPSPPLSPSGAELPVAGEAKSATLLYCRLDPVPAGAVESVREAYQRLREQFVVRTCEHLQQAEGTMLYGEETGFLALFGVPLAYEDHARRAVRVALALQSLWQGPYGVPGAWRGVGYPMSGRLQGRLGVHTAQVLLWRYPHATTPAWPMLGTARTVVTQLAQQAASGAICLSETTARQVRNLVSLTAVPPMAVAASPRPMPVYQVVREILPSTVPPQRSQRPFVGRRQELAVLHELLEQVRRGRGQIVSLMGEPGMGKSRLLAEFWQGLDGQAVTYLEGRCQAESGTPLRDLISQVCDLVLGDPLPVIRDKVRRTLRHAGLDPDAGGSALLGLLSGHTSAGLHPGGEAEECLNQVVATTCQLILNQSRQQPHIIVAEDLQWRDRLFDACCALLADQLLQAPVLLVGTYRPGGAPPWLTRAAATQLVLTPLGLQDSATVVQAVSSPAVLPAAVQKAITSRAAGNPYFLEEWTRAVLEAESWSGTLTLPDTIRDVMLARIDHLPAAAKRLLHTAAVLGQSGSVRLLQALWDGPEALAALLDILQQRVLLIVSSSTGEPAYAFCHALVQEVAYASLLPAQRHLLHVRAGQALETCYADRLAIVCEALAHHATRALASLADWPGVDQEERQLTLVLQVAQAWSFLGRFADSRTLLEQHQIHLESLGPSALTGRYYFRLGRTYSLLGEHSRAATCTRQALVAATASGDTVTMGQTQYELARERFLTGPPRASLQHGEAAVRLLEQTEAQWWLGMAHWVVGVAYALLGDFAQALEATARTEAVGVALQDPHVQSYAAFTTGWIEAMRGAPHSGLAACQRACDLALEPVNTAHAVGSLGYAYLEYGETSRALPLLQQAAQHWQQFGMPAMQGWMTTLWAEALLAQGDTALATALAEQGRTIADAARFPFAIGLAQRAQGRVALAHGALESAMARLTQALQTFSTIEARFELGRTHLDLASLAQAQGDQLVVVRHLTAALSLFQALQVPVYSARTHRAAQACGVSLPGLPR